MILAAPRYLYGALRYRALAPWKPKEDPVNTTLKTGLALAALALVTPTLAQAQGGGYRAGPTYRAAPSSYLATPPSSLPGVQVSNEPDFWEQQKQTARERMEQALQEKVDCATKYATPSYVRDCQVSAEKWRAYWNERLLSASRESERLAKTPGAKPAP